MVWATAASKGDHDLPDRRGPPRFHASVHDDPMRHRSLDLASSLLALLAAPSVASVAAPSAPLTPQEALVIASNAYIYGYSLVTIDVMRLQMSNVAKATDLKAPHNQFLNIKIRRSWPPSPVVRIRHLSAAALRLRRIARTCAIT